MGQRITVVIQCETDESNLPRVIGVQGPLMHKGVCYGILEEARQFIQSFQPEKNGIVVANGSVDQLVPNGVK